MRIRMVTRTVKATTATVMCVNTDTAEVTNHDFVLTGEYKGNDDVMKYINKHMLDELPSIVKPVTVVKTEVSENLYGMSEADFIRLSKPLPPRTKDETDED